MTAWNEGCRCSSGLQLGGQEGKLNVKRLSGRLNVTLQFRSGGSLEAAHVIDFPMLSCTIGAL